jgi:hypothetical protein
MMMQVEGDCQMLSPRNVWMPHSAFAKPVQRRPVRSHPPQSHACTHAADRTVSLILKRIIGDFVLLDITPDLVARPIRHWIQLQDIQIAQHVEVVEFEDPGALPCLRLLTAHAGDPDGELFQLFLKRHDLRSVQQVRLRGPQLGPKFASCSSGVCSGSRLSMRISKKCSSRRFSS